MKLFLLANQSYEIEDEYLVWGVDVQTKLLIKVYVKRELFSNFNIGDKIDVPLFETLDRQEIRAININRLDGEDNTNILKYLEAKSSIPASVIKPSYYGTVAKIEEIISIDNNCIMAKIIGFPKENKFLEIHDAKWNSYIKNCCDLYDINSLINIMNENKNKYILIDFPRGIQSGNIHVAAMVVM